MLLAILWTKATHTREGSLQPRRRKVDERAHLDRQKPVGRIRERNGQRCRLEFFKRSRPTQTKVCPSNIRTVTRSSFLRDHLRGFNVGVNNPTGAIMGEIIRPVSKSEREHILLIQKARAICDSVFPPADPIGEQRDKGPQLLGPSGANAQFSEAFS